MRTVIDSSVGRLGGSGFDCKLLDVEVEGRLSVRSSARALRRFLLYCDVARRTSASAIRRARYRKSGTRWRYSELKPNVLSEAEVWRFGRGVALGSVSVCVAGDSIAGAFSMKNLRYKASMST